MIKGKSYLYEARVEKLTVTLDPKIIEWVRTKGKRKQSKFVNKILTEAMNNEQTKQEIQ